VTQQSQTDIQKHENKKAIPVAGWLLHFYAFFSFRG